MAEITLGGLWIRWSSLSKRDKRTLAAAALLSGVSGFLAGAVDDRMSGGAGGPTLADMLWIAAPLCTLAAMIWLLARFSARQDELYRALEGMAMKVAAVMVFFVLFAAMVVNEALGVWLLKPDGSVLVCVVAYMVGWIVATRRLL